MEGVGQEPLHMIGARKTREPSILKFNVLCYPLSYAIIFEDNRISRDMLLDLDKVIIVS